MISGSRVLNSGIYVSPTFTMGIDICVIYCGLVNEIRSMTFLFIFEKIFAILINLLLIFQLFIYHSLAFDYYMFSHISYSISFHLIFMARLIRLLFSY